MLAARPGAKEVRRWLLAVEDDPLGVGAPPLASREGIVLSFGGEVGTGGGLDLILPAESVGCARQEGGRAEAIRPDPTPRGAEMKMGKGSMTGCYRVAPQMKKLDRRRGKRK